MARAVADDDQEKPLDPAAEKLRKRLIRFMAINFGLLFLALMVVIGALVYKTSVARRTPTAPAAGDIPAPAGGPASADIVLPAGAKILSQSLSGDRLLLDTQLAGGGRALFVYDVGKRRMIGRFSIRTE
jgi:hypothetical protein